MEELVKLHKNPMVDFSADEDTDQEIEILTREITEIFHNAQKSIRRIGRPPKGFQENPDETKIRQNVQVALATSLQDASHAFRKVQTDYLNRLKGTEDRNREALAGNSLINEDFDEYLDKGFNAEQLGMLVGVEELAVEREREITQIVQSIGELAQIFREMHVLVIEQGTILDRIDYNIEKVVTYTSEAVGELTQANKSQKAYGKKLCILLLIVIVVCLALALVIVKKVVFPGDTPTAAPTTSPGNRSYVYPDLFALMLQ